MKFIRLRLKDYRGIEDCDVNLDPAGITVIQGRNEAGKSSLAESISLLFEYPDNSKSKPIKAINPVHRDAGPEIELEAESGPYRFTYTKRFHKKPMTQLVVTEPAAENLTGRDAHNRAEEILRETIDIDLWKALTVHQGDEISQPDLAAQTSLSAALDRSAGGHSDESQGDDLYDRVHQEFLQYFTEGGAEKSVLKDSRNAESEITSGIDSLQGQLADLEKDIARSVSLAAEITELTGKEQELSESLEEHNAALEKISGLSHKLETAELRLDKATLAADHAKSASDERHELVGKVAVDTEKLAELKATESDSAAAARSAEDEYRTKNEIFKKVESQKTEAEALAKLRRDDHSYYINQIDLELLTERKNRIDEARAKAAEAQGLLASNLVDAGALKKIAAAERNLIEARARLETGAPRLQLRALEACGIDIDGAGVDLKKAEERELTVAESMKVTIPDLLEITVSAGSSLEELTSAAETALSELDQLCEKHGVSSHDEAKDAYEARVEAERIVESREKVEEENLRDLTYGEVEEKIAELSARVSGYLEGRSEEPGIAPDEKSAKTEMAVAEEALKVAAQELEAARGDMESAREVRDERNSMSQQSQTEIKLLGDELERNVGKLANARSADSDESLVIALEAANAAVTEEKKSAVTARADLQAENPEQIEALASTAEGSLRTIRERLGEARTEQTQVRTSLKLKGEEGIHEKLEEERRRLDNVLSDNASLFRRADAARLLFETMRAEREESRRAYVAPLKQAIERLGKLVFNETFQVEVDEDLQIAMRTLDGVTVDFSSLSGGAREQLSLIFRLACCDIMAEDGGTPMILDDALGYSDLIRLKTMGAVLARAARDTQIIVLTCMPSRYSDVGEAKIIRLD